MGAFWGGWLEKQKMCRKKKNIAENKKKTLAFSPRICYDNYL